jgi:exodeoxyribonuclease V beta subunit
MKPFDLMRTALEESVTLIEASAGTGKTHTIAGLFLRLLVERRAHGEPIDVDEILVVTYTEAATEELRDRIRRLLAQAVKIFKTGQRRRAGAGACLASFGPSRRAGRTACFVASLF